MRHYGVDKAASQHAPESWPFARAVCDTDPGGHWAEHGVWDGQESLTERCVNGLAGGIEEETTRLNSHPQRLSLIHI